MIKTNSLIQIYTYIQYIEELMRLEKEKANDKANNKDKYKNKNKTKNYHLTKTTMTTTILEITHKSTHTNLTLLSLNIKGLSDEKKEQNFSRS